MPLSASLLTLSPGRTCIAASKTTDIKACLIRITVAVNSDEFDSYELLNLPELNAAYETGLRNFKNVNILSDLIPAFDLFLNRNNNGN